MIVFFKFGPWTELFQLFGTNLCIDIILVLSPVCYQYNYEPMTQYINMSMVKSTVYLAAACKEAGVRPIKNNKNNQVVQ